MASFHEGLISTISMQCLLFITIPKGKNGGTYGKYDDGFDRKPHTMTWSITIQSDNDNECVTLGLKANDWFDHIGTKYLKAKDVNVQSVGDLTNRDNILTAEYEYRKGFDVVFWLLSVVENPDNEVGYVEGVIFEQGQIEREPTIDELNEKLQTRLTGR